MKKTSQYQRKHNGYPKKEEEKFQKITQKMGKQQSSVQNESNLSYLKNNPHEFNSRQLPTIYGQNKM